MSKSGFITIIVLVLLVFLAFAYLSSIKQENFYEELASSQAGSALSEEATYLNITGETVGLNSYLGQPIVAIAWASWCPDCAQQLKLLTEISKDYDSVATLAFNRAEPVSTVSDYLEFHQLSSELEIILDTNDYFFTSIEGSQMPEIIIFDPSGNIFHHQKGTIKKEDLLQLLDEVEK